MSDSLEKFITMQVAELGMDKVYSELVALRKRVDATEQRIAELERGKSQLIYDLAKEKHDSSKFDPTAFPKVEKQHNPQCLCKDCHEEKTLPPFQDVEEIGVVYGFGFNERSRHELLNNCATLLANSRLDQQRIQILVKEYKAIINGLGYCSPYWNERVEATLRLAGCDKI